MTKMSYVTIAVSLLTATFLVNCARSPFLDGMRGPTAIVNGRTVGQRALIARSIVGVVLKLDQGEALCTGTLIGPNTVLTAAHCVDNSPQAIAIVFSTHLKNAAADKIRKGTGYVQNPNWGQNSKQGRGDLALIRFAGSVPKGYHPVTLSDQVPTKSEKILVAGYGVTDGTQNSGAGVLRQTEVRLVGMLSPTEMETDGESHSVCFGDSGGPAFIRVTRKWVQIGVASAVANKACDEASVHTLLRSYLGWIRANR